MTYICTSGRIFYCPTGEGAVGRSHFLETPPPIAAPEIFHKNTTMINTIFKKAAETFNKPTVSQPVSQPSPTPEPAPAAAPAKPTPAPTPAPEPKPIDQSPKALALRAAEAAGFIVNNEYHAEICRHQRGRHPHLLMVTFENWHVPARCWVKDAQSWLPVSEERFRKLWAKYTGMATVEGELEFQSAAISKKNRLRKAR